MTTGVLLTPPIVQFTFNNGQPAAGASVLFQVGGVNTAVYQDSALTTPLPNPVPLNSRGEISNAAGASCQCFLTPNVTYTATVSDAGGNTIWVANYVNGLLTSVLVSIIEGASTSTAILASLVQTPAEIAASVTPVNYAYAPYNFLRYGADSIGGAPCDTAFNNAIAVLAQIPGGTLTIPPGVYSFANVNTVLQNKSGILIQGVGGPSSGAQPGTRLQFTGTGTGTWFNLSGAQGVQFRNLQLTHTQAGFTGTYVALPGDASNCALIDCTVGAGVSAAVLLDVSNCQSFTSERTVYQNGNPCVQAISGFSNIINFRGGEFFNCAVAPVQINITCDSWSFRDVDFEALSTAGRPPGALLSQSSSGKFFGLSITGCWFGDAQTAVGTWINIYTQGFSFHGNYISGNATGSTAFAFNQSFSVSIQANYFDTFLNGINFATATCADIIVKGNLFASVTNAWVNGNNVTAGTFDWGANFGAASPGSNHGAPTNNNGYEVTAQKLIRQWGLFSATTANGTVSFNTNGINFPTACTHAMATLSSVGSTANTIYVAGLTTTGFTYTIGGAFTNPTTFYWEAKGN